jgi:hypothetical protein
VGDLASALADEYDAPRDVILRDVLALLQDLADKRLLTLADTAPDATRADPTTTPPDAEPPDAEPSDAVSSPDDA